MDKPFTEQSNPLSESIDICNAEEIVGILAKTDEQIFSGVNDRNLLCDDVLQTIVEVSNLVKSVLCSYSPRDVAIVLGGCGTSGRLAFLISRICNALYGDQFSAGPFYYSVAGGDKAVLTSVEAPEDDPAAGVQSLLRICKGKSKVVYIAVTCGISAPFVAGQLEFCTQHLDIYTPVLLGFNPVTLARNVKISNWNRTVREVALDIERISREGKAYVINPILGGESITGSSRMKGGSATKIILEALFFTSINGASSKSSPSITKREMLELFEGYRIVCRNFYESEASTVMAQLIKNAAEAFRNSGCIRYLASDWTGVLGLIDSTECPPTYGASVNDVRGFIPNGYQFLGIEDFGKTNELLQLSIEDFIRMYQAKDSSSIQDSIIVFIQSSTDPIIHLLREGLGECLKNMRNCGNSSDNGSSRSITAVLMENIDDSTQLDVKTLVVYFDQIYRVTIPKHDCTVIKTWSMKCQNAYNESLASCCLKWMLNATSTGGHVLLGKVWKNYMCDVKVSNSKLYHRAIEIVEIICGNISYEKAKQCLLKSIYDVDELPQDVYHKLPADHYSVKSKDKIVPVAIILASLGCSLTYARDLLRKHSAVRSALLEVTKK